MKDKEAKGSSQRTSFSPVIDTASLNLAKPERGGRRATAPETTQPGIDKPANQGSVAPPAGGRPSATPELPGSSTKPKSSMHQPSPAGNNPATSSPRQEQPRGQDLSKPAQHSIDMSTSRTTSQRSDAPHSGDDLDGPRDLETGSSSTPTTTRAAEDGQSGLTKEDKIRQKIQDTQNVLKSDLQKALARGERMDKMENDAEQLKEQTQVFHKESQKTAARTKWLAHRSKVICISVAIGVFVLLLLLIGLALAFK